MELMLVTFLIADRPTLYVIIGWEGTIAAKSVSIQSQHVLIIVGQHSVQHVLIRP